MKERDLLLLLVYATQSFGSGDAFALDLVKKSTTQCFLVANKIDALPQKEVLLPLLDRYHKLHAFEELVPISARTGDNLEHLVETIIRYLPEGPQYFPPGHITDQPARFLIDPKDHIAGRRDVRRRGLAVVGFYHSHPHSPAEPSDADRAEANYADHLYLIVSLASNPPAMSVFTFERGNFRPLPFVTVP